MTKVGVIGAGHVGLVVAACLAHLGHHVTCLEKDRVKLMWLRGGHTPFLEPGLPQLIAAESAAGRLRFSGSCRTLAGAEVTFVTVDTPARPGGIDISNVFAAIEVMARVGGERPPVIAIKTTVPPGTTAAIDRRMRKEMGSPVSIVVNPEFLREGNAIADFMHPDRVVIGSSSKEAAQVVARLYNDLACQILLTDCASAELIKLASNAFLATKISFINEIAAVCEVSGADVRQVAYGMGLDHRIGAEYLRAGLGFGGSCLPKDLRILIDTARSRSLSLQMLPSALSVNDEQVHRVMKRLEEALGGLNGRRIAVLGLTFKSGTDDLRESPALRLAEELLRQGVSVRTCDPAAALSANLLEGCYVDVFEAADGCDAVVLATEWPQFCRLDLRHLRQVMRNNVLVDARNALNERAVAAAGFSYLGLGRGSPDDTGQHLFG
jgi:UDPglucose 6-dehydrogenase